MAIIRGNKLTEKFTTIPNDLINDPRMSFKAKGVLLYILSKPEHWVVRVSDLKRAGNCGEVTIYSALTEIEEAGYLIREKTKDEKGHWVYNQVVREYSSKPQENP